MVEDIRTTLWFCDVLNPPTLREARVHSLTNFVSDSTEQLIKILIKPSCLVFTISNMRLFYFL